MTPSQLVAIMPAAASRAALFVPILNDAMDEFGINTSLRQVGFLAVVAHESAELLKFEEGLNYSAEALTRSWPARFPSVVAAAYARQPERIANRAYANREGNRDEASGDGWRNRGAGAIQLTFENNHAACARYFGLSRERIATWLRTPEGACRSAGWFWRENGLNAWADIDDFDGVCDKVNIGKKTRVTGDSIGWEKRLAYRQRAGQAYGR